jgi:hypothetical protein
MPRFQISNFKQLRQHLKSKNKKRASKTRAATKKASWEKRKKKKRRKMEGEEKHSSILSRRSCAPTPPASSSSSFTSKSPTKTILSLWYVLIMLCVVVAEKISYFCCFDHCYILCSVYSSWLSSSHWCFRMGPGQIWITRQRFSSWERHNEVFRIPHSIPPSASPSPTNGHSFPQLNVGAIDWVPH